MCSDLGLPFTHSEEERRRQEEAERRAKLDEIAEKQRQREAEAEERAKREREAILAKADEGRPGRFVPSSLRKRTEDPSSTDSAPPTERKPLVLTSSRLPSAREDSDKWQRPAEREPEHATRPTEAAAPAAPGKYQPPVRREGRYEPPVRRTREPYSGDAPPPARAAPGGRYGASDRYADSDRESQRPTPFGANRGDDKRGGDDRWSRGGATRPTVGGGSERTERPTERPPLFRDSNKEDGDNWRRNNPDEGRPKPAEVSAA
jgi:translation initiation factor 3 subunit A